VATDQKPALQTVGNYDLTEKIAEGGMGTVYKARHRQTGQIVAVKVVASHITTNQVLLKRFEQEYNAAKQLNHPNIVRAIEYGDTGTAPYLVMEYVEGESLGKRLEREGAMPEKEAIKLIAQVAQALHRAHKEKLIHRDVKPDNILVTPDGVAKLADLGLVKEVEADLNLTRTGRGLGTPHFMAPEQFKNAKNVDATSDIYSLGATLYMMVTGEMPFRSSGPLDAYMKKIENKLTSPRELVPALSERVDWAIRRAMSAEKELRPTSCREFVEDLTGRSTRKVTSPDPVAAAAAEKDVWYLIYKDEEGASHTVKGTTAGILRSLKEGLLGDASNIRASRTKATESFEPLRNIPEFRHVAISLTPGASPAPTPAPPPAPTPSAKNRLATPMPSSKSNAGSVGTTPAPSRNRAFEVAESGSGKTVPGRKAWPLWLQILILLLMFLVGVIIFVIIFRLTN
jgi:serine/threonine protein kinase